MTPNRDQTATDRVVAIDRICHLPITAAAVEHDLDCLDRLLCQPAARWAWPELSRRWDELRRLLKESTP